MHREPAALELREDDRLPLAVDRLLAVCDDRASRGFWAFAGIQPMRLSQYRLAKEIHVP